MLKLYTLVFSFLLISSLATAQGSESFTNMPANDGGYVIRNWTGDNGLPWVATDARTDQPLNGRAIAIRNGSLTCNNIPGGISSITFTHQQKFTGSGSVLQVYVNGSLVGSANPTTTVASTTITPLNISGNFNLEFRQVTSGLRIAIDDVSWEGLNNNPPCAEPTGQPTNLVLNSTPNTVNGSFTAATPEANEYLVVRSTSAALSAPPADADSYTAGQALGGGTVVGVYSGTSFTDGNLVASTQYYYFIFALNSEDCNGGPNYLTANPLTSSVTTQAIPPCLPPTTAGLISLTAANNFINGVFVPAASANRYLVVISASQIPGASPVNGTSYNPGQVFGSGTVVSYGAATNFTATGLTANTTYYFFVFAANAECTGQPYYNSTASSASATTTNTSTGIPTGYYSTATGLTCQNLKTALKEKISVANNIGYDGLWTAYQFTDIKPGTTNVIWDIYTDDNEPTVPETFNFIYSADQCGNYNSEGDCYNREHSTPKSWFNDATPMHNDIFHVIPTDGWVNGARSNWPYGEVINAGFTSIDNQSKRGTGNNFGYTGTVFQPNAAFRGDVARMSLYMATRYEDQIISQNWAGANAEAGPAMLTSGEEGFDDARRRLQIYNTWYLRTMFKWMSEDPVSQKEVDRNNAVYYQSGQGNRNPFVDHPEYAALIWQCTGVLPVTITDFVAQKQTSNALLKWYATYETNFKLFEIERSPNGSGFYKIGEVAGANLANYSFIDNDLPNGPIVYYRLKMIDIDGTFNYSKTLPLRLNNNFANALVYPNPTTGPLNIRLTQTTNDNGWIVVTDVAGRIVKQQYINKGAFSIDLKVSELPAGRYFIRINDKQNIIRQSFVVIK